MERLVKTLIFVAIVAVLIKEALPRVMEQLESSPVASWAPGTLPEPVRECLQRAARARQEYGSTRSLTESAREMKSRRERSFVKAREACDCRLASCRRADQGLDILAELGSGAGPEIAVSLQEFDEVLVDARRLARAD